MIKSHKSLIFKMISVNYRKYQTIIDSELKKINISRGDYPFLLCLYENRNGLNQNQLSKLLSVDRAHTNRYVHKLAKDGYIYSKSNLSNSRILDIFLTDKGVSKSEEALVILSNLANSLFSDEKDSDLDFLYNKLLDISKILDNKLE